MKNNIEKQTSVFIKATSLLTTLALLGVYFASHVHAMVNPDGLPCDQDPRASEFDFATPTDNYYLICEGEKIDTTILLILLNNLDPARTDEPGTAIISPRVEQTTEMNMPYVKVGNTVMGDVEFKVQLANGEIATVNITREQMAALISGSLTSTTNPSTEQLSQTPIPDSEAAPLATATEEVPLSDPDSATTVYSDPKQAGEYIMTGTQPIERNNLSDFLEAFKGIVILTGSTSILAFIYIGLRYYVFAAKGKK